VTEPKKKEATGITHVTDIAPQRPRIVVWLGAASPIRTIRWLDGALACAAQLGAATAVAAGSATWLDLAADRAMRAKVGSAGIATDLALDYLGWGQLAAAAAKLLAANLVLVDEASRPERFAEVAAIAELMDAAQLTQVVALEAQGGQWRATRAAGDELQTIRVSGLAVVGVRIPGAEIDEYPTPLPSPSMRKLDFETLGLDASVLAHRAVPVRSPREVRRTVEHVADALAVHVAARRRIGRR
jgi:electron transfer flavoprotein alpha/beta subunit